MSFGGLLGSLYGDLPAPKSGPLPPELAEKVAVPPTKSKQSEVVKPVAVPQEDPVTAPSTTVDPPVKKLAITGGPTAAVLQLMPISTRRRQSNNTVPKKPRESVTGEQTSRIKLLASTDTRAPTPQPLLPAQNEPVDGINRLLPQKVVNEYDPTRPNSYDDYVKERARVHRKREEERHHQEEMERLIDEQRRAVPATAPSLAVSGDEAYLWRQHMSAAMFGGAAVEDVSSDISGKKKQGFAEKMLEKMGWKHGEGLGREKQGIVAPLVARKTDKRSGVIVQGGKVSAAESLKKNDIKETLRKDATRIVLLTNLVGRGEVDNDLEAESAEEAAKYGHLLAVKIVELPNLSDDECVRIFCEFESIEAFINFDKRLFGGRSVKAQFFNEDLYANAKLSS